MGLAERHSLILRDPAGSHIEPDINGFVVRSARSSGSALVVVPDVDALVALASEEGWSERDIAAVRKRWGGLEAQVASTSRFSFGLGGRSSTQRAPESPAERPGTGEPKPPGSFTPFFQGTSPFSNWHKAAFVVDGKKFNCVEQYLMYAKATLFSDDDTVGSILSTPDPRQQKALGRQVSGFVESVWIENRVSIARTGVLAKFSQNPHLREALLGTAGTELVEASPYDKIWGVGLPATDPRINDRSQWRGENLLGKILTEVREHLMTEQRMTHARSGRDCSSAATERGHGAQAPRFQFGPAVQPTQGAEVALQPPRRQRDGG
ncbi:NADAR family protein (plasmid) [Cupriavidus pinatubonensis]|nr:NADAR family protein [Cupriavidus pinatubonensis]